MPDGSPVDLYTLAHEKGMRASIATYGATLVELVVPDIRGNLDDVVLGYDGLEGYLNDRCYFGCMVGRVANRIARARFALDGREYVLEKNNGAHHLHGGNQGFNARLWTATPASTQEGPALTLEYVSPDGEGGYPGRVTVSVTYTLTAHALRMDCRAQTQAPTMVNLTNHTYFNLGGDPRHGIGDHEVTLYASRYLPTDADLIPSGEIRDVKGSRMDFTRPELLDERLKQAPAYKGYDHFYVLDAQPDASVPAARVHHKPSGRMLELSTTQPGVHLYTGGGIPQGLQGKGGTTYGPGAGLCLETQGYPDAPNHPGFASIILRPGRTYTHATEFRFHCT